VTRIAYVNGRYTPHREAAVHVEDRGYQFGDGVYEVVPVQNGALIDVDLHFARLARSLRELLISPPMAEPSLRAVLANVIRRNRIRDGIVYLQITRGVARRDHGFPKFADSAIVVTARRSAALPDDADSWAGTAVTVPDIRWGRCDIKSVNLLPNVLAKQVAREAGAYEAILIGPGDIVMEGSTSNVWIVDAEGALRTRPLDNHILPGCTRAAIAQLLAENDIELREEEFSIATLAAAREVFVTSATSLVKPIIAIDGKPVANGAVGSITRRLFDLFIAHVRRQTQVQPEAQTQAQGREAA